VSERDIGYAVRVMHKALAPPPLRPVVGIDVHTEAGRADLRASSSDYWLRYGWARMPEPEQAQCPQRLDGKRRLMGY
jgi:hypothetical protein